MNLNVTKIKYDAGYSRTRETTISNVDTYTVMMNPRLQSASTLAILSLALFSCHKNDEPQPVVKPACVLQKEMTDDGNTVLYHYDNDGKLMKAEKYNPYLMTHVLDVFYDKVTLAEVNKLHPMTLTTNYGVDFMTTPPDVAYLSVAMDNATPVNWRTYFFYYDVNGRLTRLAEETETTDGDDEWELLISYNDHDNVSKMVYNLTSGKPSVSTVIIVDDFDSNQTPYAGVKGYKFLTTNWDNSDSSPIITALSKNNPKSYRLIVNEVETMTISMQYQYNEQGFPITRAMTRKNETGELTSSITYDYMCM